MLNKLFISLENKKISILVKIKVWIETNLHLFIFLQFLKSLNL
jgi:hypothetical protein